MKASPVVQRTRQAGVVGEQQVGDRAEQVRLANARGAADEQRVVGLRGHLGDGQRGGVGEAVAVADDELVEGQLGVAERAGAGRARRDVGRRAPAALARATGASRARRVARAGACAAPWRRSPARRARRSCRAEHLLDAGLEHAPEALADPAAACARRLQVSCPRRAPAAAAARARCGRSARRRQRELGLHARPYVLELGAHGSVNPLLPERVDGYSEEGPRAPVGRL